VLGVTEHENFLLILFEGFLRVNEDKTPHVNVFIGCLRAVLLILAARVGHVRVAIAVLVVRLGQLVTELLFVLLCQQVEL